MNEQAKDEMEVKLVALKEQFLAQLNEGRSRLENADVKIQHFYLGIEVRNND